MVGRGLHHCLGEEPCADAIEILDLVGSVDDDHLTKITHSAVMVTLRPQDDGTFVKGDCGEWMYGTILSAYPLLEALYERTGGDPGPDELKAVIQAERKRLIPETEPTEAEKERAYAYEQVGLVIESASMIHAPAGAWAELRGLWDLAKRLNIVIDHKVVAERLREMNGAEIAASYEWQVSTYVAENEQ